MDVSTGVFIGKKIVSKIVSMVNTSATTLPSQIANAVFRFWTLRILVYVGHYRSNSAISMTLYVTQIIAILRHTRFTSPTLVPSCNMLFCGLGPQWRRLIDTSYPLWTPGSPQVHLSKLHFPISSGYHKITLRARKALTSHERNDKSESKEKPASIEWVDGSRFGVNPTLSDCIAL